MQKLLLFVVNILRVTTSQRTDVCSQVHLMSQYCTSQGANGSTSINDLKDTMDMKLEEMETRLRLTLGAPPAVNYTFVEESISARFRDVEARVVAKLGTPPKVNYTAIEESISSRFEHLKALVNEVAEDGTSIVDYARIFQQIGERYTAIRAYVDSKFAQLVNDTEAYQEAVESMNRQINISDCREIRLEDAKLCNATGGVFDIYRGIKKYEVFCDSYTDGGGWTVFQRRMDGSTLFNRTWAEYVNGFGERHREFWLGLKIINELLQGGTHELRIDLMDSSGRIRFAKYGIFYVAGKSRNYNLLLQSYTGDAGNHLASGYPFSAIDKDLDIWSRNCADHYSGGWWYSNCGSSALNANYAKVAGKNPIYWHGFTNVVRTEMKFRRLIED